MTQTEIAARVRKLIAERLDIAEASLADDAEFAALNCDSIDLLEVMMSAEDEFGIELPEDETDLFVTVKDAIDLVTRLVPKDSA